MNFVWFTHISSRATASDPGGKSASCRNDKRLSAGFRGVERRSLGHPRAVIGEHIEAKDQREPLEKPHVFKHRTQAQI